MNVEFHYYILHFLAQRAGFCDRDAWILACSSQFVDNNLSAYSIVTERGVVHSAPTQNYGWWENDFVREVYIPFHFFPGNPEDPDCRRKDGVLNPLVVTPHSARVKRLLVAALKTRDLYRMGIAFHTYADSWAHQNFTGRQESFNVLDSSSFIPPIGHAQILRTPDELSNVWSDTRLVNQRVSNRERYLSAARMIYRYLRTFQGAGFGEEDYPLSELEELWGRAGNEKSLEERIVDYQINFSVPKWKTESWYEGAFSRPSFLADAKDIPGYDKLLWLKDSILFRSSLKANNSVQGNGDFYESNFWNWRLAADAHKQEARNLTSDLKY